MKTKIAADPSQSHGRLRCKTSQLLHVAAIALALAAACAHAVPISVISGTTGSFTAGQSYNETRAVDVTVLSPYNLLVQSMTLTGFNENGNTVTVGARIYDETTHALIASADSTATAGPVTVPISALLLSGDQYVIGFFGHLGTATGFLPSSFPYTESSGLLRIDGASESPTDSFPLNWNLEDPQISMQVSQVPEGGSIVTLAIGMFAVLGFQRLLRKQSCLRLQSVFCRM